MHEPVHDLDSLAAFVEGRLEGAERERVVAHLAACAECRRTLAQMGRALASGDLPHISRSAAPRSRWQSPHMWVPLAASVLIGSFAWFYATSGLRPAPGASDGDVLVRRGPELNVAGNTVREYIFTNPDGTETRLRSADPGRALITGVGQETGTFDNVNAFKISPLWGIRRTAPYFHDNSAKTLEAVAAHYALFFSIITDPDGPGPAQPLIVLTPQDQADIVAYMKLLE